MKWNIRNGNFPYGTKDSEKNLFEQMDLKYDDGDEGLKKELMGYGFVEWITYPIENKATYTEDELKAIDLYSDQVVKAPITRRSEVSRRKYEIFCGGFLSYHDKVFKRYQKGSGYSVESGEVKLKDYGDNKFEHKMFFEWIKGKGHEKDNDKVRIYINETPLKYNSNPPPPTPPPPPES